MDSYPSRKLELPSKQDIQKRMIGVVDVILTRQKRLLERQLGKNKVSLQEIATSVGIDSSQLSKYSRGILPKKPGTVVDHASRLGAYENETKVLLILSAAYHASLAGKDEDRLAAALLADVFSPLFTDEDLAFKFNTVANITDNVLQENNIDTSKLNLKKLNSLGLSMVTTRSAALEIMADLDRLYPQLSKCLFDIGVDKAMQSFEKYLEIIAVRFRSNRKMAKKPGVKSWTTNLDIPGIQLDIIEINPGKEIDDDVHRAIEFLAVCSGDGTFWFKDGATIKLSPKDLPVIAYRAHSPHFFKAGVDGATILIVSYLRAYTTEDDRIDDLIKRSRSKSVNSLQLLVQYGELLSSQGS